MKPCSRCRRHLLSAASPCPFCGQDNRTVGEGSALVLGLGLALAGPLGCSTGDKNTESSTNTPTTDDKTTQPTDDTFDQGGSYYAGPSTEDAFPTTSTTTTTSTTSTSTAGTDTESTVGTDSSTATTASTTSDDSLSDSGGSYYAGPSSDSDFVWGESDPAKR